MARLSRSDARDTLNRLHIPIGSNFYTLDSFAVCALVDEAKRQGYRKPANANGSTARYFHARLVRAATTREEG